MTKTFDFKTQLAVGDAGEKMFLKHYFDLIKLDGREGDFIGVSRRKIELKTDSRTTKETPNFFMEHTRNEKGDPGGPFQSQEHGVYYFCYMFADATVYWFELTTLVKHLKEHEKDYQKRSIQNKGWSAIGWLVPRASLEHLILKKETIGERDYSSSSDLS